MRKSVLGGISTSVLGFGCGSVMGRVGRSVSLHAMNVAWDAGITFFDTARSYGFGEAEAVLGEFLNGKRDQAVVATKFGIVPQKLSMVKRIAVPLARVAKQLPGVGGRLKRSGSGPNLHGEFSVAGLRTSLDTSLRELRTDRVDVLFLHEATAAVLDHHDLMAALEALVKEGKVLRVGLYGSAGVCATGLEQGPAVLSAMQFGADLLDPVTMKMPEKNQRKAMLVGNHPFGSEVRIRRVTAMLSALTVDSTVPQALREKLSGLNWDGVLEALFGMILDGAGIDALVLSMMQEKHIRQNARAVERCRFSKEEMALMQKRLLE